MSFTFEEAAAPPAEEAPAAAKQPFTFEEAAKPAAATPKPFTFEEAKAPPPAQGPMPGSIKALGQGIISAAGDIGQTYKTFNNEKPEPIREESPAAAPFTWDDALSPIDRGLPKVAYRLGKSAPALGAGIAGSVAGGASGAFMAGPIGGAVGGIGGGAAGAAAGAALQTIGPAFAEELKKTPGNPDAAWDRAVEQSLISGAASGAGWALFPVRFFQGPVKQLAFQALGVQPGVSVAAQVAQNVAAGKPATDDLGHAYVEGAVGTAVPALGHLAYRDAAGRISDRFKGDSAPPPPPPADPLRPPVGAIENTKNWWKENFQPELISDEALKADPLFARYKAGSAQEKDAIINRSEENYYRWNKVPEADVLEFFREHESGSPISPALLARHPWMQERSDAYRRMLDQAHKDEAAYGSQSGYIENYLPHIWEKPDVAAMTFQNLALPQSLGPKWFQKARYYDLIEAGLKSGLRLKNSNPEALVTDRLLSGVDMRQRVELLRSLEDQGMAIRTENAPEHITNPSWRSNSLPWQEIRAPNGESYMLAPDVQPLWKNAVEARGLWSAGGLTGNAFRGWMELKNAWVPIKLAASLFHPLHVAHINLSTNITRALHETFGKGQQGALRRIASLPEAAAQTILDTALAFPIGTPMRGKTARKGWLTPKERQTPEQKYTNELMVEGGFVPELSEQLRISAKRKISDALHSGQYLKALGKMPLRAIEVVQKPIFQEWIPNLKAAAYLREAESLFRRRPDLLNDPVNRRVALRAIGKQVDNRFGEMFYGSLFWNRTIKDASIGSFLSLGWNLGFAREFVGGALEPVARQFMKDPTPTRKLIRETATKTTNALVYTLTAFMINAMMNKAMTGDNPEGMDYIFPRIGGNNPDGSPRRITNMFYTREVPMARKHIEEEQSVIGGLSTMLYHKLMFAPFAEMGTNRDYFGYQIYDPNAPGVKQVGQFLKHLLGDQLNPMSVVGAKRALELSGKPHTTWDVLKNLNDPDVYLPLMGFGPAPSYVSKSPIQNRIGYLYRQFVAPVAKPHEQKEISEKKREARDKYLMAVGRKDTAIMREAAKELAQLGVKTQTISKLQPGTQDTYMFSRLPEHAQVGVLKQASKEEFRKYFPKASGKTKINPEIKELFKLYYRN